MSHDVLDHSAAVSVGPPPAGGGVGPADPQPQRSPSARWWERYQELRQFALDYQRLPRYDAVKGSDERSLHSWMSNQREVDARGGLDRGQHAALEQLGVFQATHRSVWWANHTLTKKFRDAHGRLPLESGDSADERRLGTWLRHAKARALTGALDQAQVVALRDLGVRLVQRPYRSPRDSARRFEELDAFLSAHGRLPKANVSAEVPAHRWLTRQFRLYREGRLADEYRPVIERALSFKADQSKSTFMRVVVDVRRFAAAHGHLPRAEGDDEERRLATWVADQAKALAEQRLAPKSVQLLVELGVTAATGQ